MSVGTPIWPFRFPSRVSFRAFRYLPQMISDTSHRWPLTRKPRFRPQAPSSLAPRVLSIFLGRPRTTCVPPTRGQTRDYFKTGVPLQGGRCVVVFTHIGAYGHVTAGCPPHPGGGTCPTPPVTHSTTTYQEYAHFRPRVDTSPRGGWRGGGNGVFVNTLSK